METVNLPLNKKIVEIANIYAMEHGETLVNMVENYLSDMIVHISIKSEKEDVPDAIMSLLGAGEPIDSDDLNGRKAYAEHIKEKHA